MKKEPVSLYLLRFVFSLGLFAFMFMLYWSSLILEKDMKGVQSQLAELTDKLSNLTLSDTHSNIASAPEHPLSDEEQLKNRPHVDPQLPNLLEPDPFYEKTLPQMLGKNFKIRGIRQDSTYGRPKNLQPFSGFADVEGWNAACNVSAATNKFGIYETLTPDMALKIEERLDPKTGIPEYWIHLRDKVYWTPLSQDQFTNQVKLAPFFTEKHQVTAHDFKFNFDVVMNPFVQLSGLVALRSYLGDIEEFRVIDDLTFVVRWKVKEVTLADGKTAKKPKYIAKLWTGYLRPLPRFVFQYFSDGKKIIEDDKDPNTYRTNSVWAQNFTRHWASSIIVGCGTWNFEEWTDQQISFGRNDQFYEPYSTLVQGLNVTFRENPDSLWQDFKADKTDTFTLRPTQISEFENFLTTDTYAEQVKRGHSIKRIDFIPRLFTYMGWNESKPYFQNKKVRQALTMAIDRNRIIQNILNGMGVAVTGPLYVGSKDYDQTIKPWPYDPQAAKRQLEEEGWFDSEGTGVISKLIDGKRVPFRFAITYYVKNPTSEAVSSYIATALKEIGIDVSLNGVDVADLTNSIDDKSFDALLMAWTGGSPPDDVRQIWASSGAKEKGSSNSIGFANPEVDKIIDQLDYEYIPEKRTELYHQFHKILHEEQPYTFLYNPKASYLYREYVQNVFIPADRQDLIPGADMESPQPQIYWLKQIN